MDELAKKPAARLRGTHCPRWPTFSLQVRSRPAPLVRWRGERRGLQASGQR